jgi:hypothetical protein
MLRIVYRVISTYALDQEEVEECEEKKENADERADPTLRERQERDPTNDNTIRICE